MAILRYWSNFSKRKNSTKQPTDASGTEITVNLKEPTSLENPVFIVTGLMNANYCQFNGSYYYIDDVVVVTSSIVEWHCSMDALATNKSAIVGSSQYVAYYSHNNTEIVDSRLSTKTTATVGVNTESFERIGEGSSYLLSVTGTDGVSVYACDRSTVDTILPSSVLTNIKNNWDNNLDAIKNIQTTWNVTDAIKTCVSNLCEMFWEQANSLSCWDGSQNSIRNCYIIPVDKDELGGSSSEIILGRLATSKYGNKGLTRIIHDSATVTIPWQGVTDWRRNAPYMCIYLYIPYVGLTQIAPSQVMDSNTITVNASLDTYSGACLFQVVGSNNTVIAHYSTNLASSYAIGMSNFDVMGTTQNIVSAGSQIAGGIGAIVPKEHDVISGTNSIIGGALGLCNSIETFNTSIGTNTGMAGQGFGNNVRCITVFHDTTVSPSSVSSIMGTPYNGVMSIPSSGYVQTVNASIDNVAYGGEKDTINSMLNTGIYIE